ncbi:MAG: hypothetical protein HMLKMBBP_03551 [Planctomycetes bacterium]|nr:hypothetical protein [Planctomycetota bacterium]
MRILGTLAIGVVALGAAAFVAARPFGPGDAAYAGDGQVAGEVEWFADYDKAVEAAKAQKKDLLVDFTGSDWCGWCIRLHKEVFEQAEFKAEAPKDYVLCALDFPNGEAAKAKVPNPARNQELSQKHGIQGFPTILLLTADGDVIAQTGYQPGGAKPYVEHLAKIRTAGKEAIAAASKLEAEYAAAKPEEQGAVVGRALDILEKLGSPAGPGKRIAAVAAHAMTADPKNEKGLQLRAVKALLGAGLADEKVVEAGRALDPKNDQGLLELVLAHDMQAAMMDESGEKMAPFIQSAVAFAKIGNFKDPEVYVGALANAAGMAKQVLGDDASARTLAQALRDKGPKDNPRLDAFLKQLLDTEAPEAPEAPKPPEAPKAPDAPK